MEEEREEKGTEGHALEEQEGGNEEEEEEEDADEDKVNRSGLSLISSRQFGQKAPDLWKRVACLCSIHTCLIFVC